MRERRLRAPRGGDTIASYLRRFRGESVVADLVFVLLTLAVFALLGLCARGAAEAVNAANAVGLGLAIVFAVLLVIALLFPSGSDGRRSRSEQGTRPRRSSGFVDAPAVLCRRRCNDHERRRCSSSRRCSSRSWCTARSVTTWPGRCCRSRGTCGPSGVIYRLGGVDPDADQTWGRLPALRARLQRGLGAVPLRCSCGCSSTLASRRGARR